MSLAEPDPRVGAACGCGLTTIQALGEFGLRPEPGRQYCIFGYCRPQEVHA